MLVSTDFFYTSHLRFPNAGSQTQFATSKGQAKYCWWFRNPKQPPGMVIKPCKQWDNLPYQLVGWISEPSTVSLDKVAKTHPKTHLWLCTATITTKCRAALLYRCRDHRSWGGPWLMGDISIWRRSSRFLDLLRNLLWCQDIYWKYLCIYVYIKYSIHYNIQCMNVNY